jgi:membrane glycosyltransferase
MLFSALLAPVRMLFHTHFVVTTFLGKQTSWKSPPRDDTETTWREALRRHGGHTLLGLVWASVVYCLSPSFLCVVGAMTLSIPISVLSSRISLGRRLRKERLFLIPEEDMPPPELEQTRDAVRAAAATPGFIDAAVVPTLNALVCAVGVVRGKQSTIHHARPHLVQRALRDGPHTLRAAEKTILLNDPISMSQLHFEVWSSAGAHAVWRNARTSISAVPPAAAPNTSSFTEPAPRHAS